MSRSHVDEYEYDFSGTSRRVDSQKMTEVADELTASNIALAVIGEDNIKMDLKEKGCDDMQ